MNDPGLDDPIQRDAKAVQERTSSQSDGGNADEAEDEQAYLKPRFVSLTTGVYAKSNATSDDFDDSGFSYMAHMLFI